MYTFANGTLFETVNSFMKQPMVIAPLPLNKFSKKQIIQDKHGVYLCKLYCYFLKKMKSY